jgi:hypothetical protein
MRPQISRIKYQASRLKRQAWHQALYLHSRLPRAILWPMWSALYASTSPAKCPIRNPAPHFGGNPLNAAFGKHLPLYSAEVSI